jgi:hypothetical protein
MKAVKTSQSRQLKLDGGPAFERAAAVEEVHIATALYTTMGVVDALLDKLEWPHSGGRLLDPSAGDGSFLIRALQRLDLTKAREIERVQGWEIHPGAAQEARAKVASLLRRAGWSEDEAKSAAARTVVNKDFLTDGPEANEFRIIAGNPPYLRFQRLPDFFKTIYGEQLPKYARADLLHAFLDRCAKMLPDDGACGLICSDRFLFNSTAADLRRELGHRVGISHLARLDASTSFYRPKLRVKDSPPRIHPVELVLRPTAFGQFPITHEAISPDDPGRTEQTNGRTLADIAKVSIAPWLGPIGIFVVTGDVATLLHAAGAELIPAVDTDDIEPGTDILRTPTRYAIRTYRAVQPAGILEEHLKSQRERMPKRGLSNPFWVPPETINLPLDRPTLLIPRIARGLRAIPLPAGVLPINHNLSVVSTTNMPLKELRELLLSESSQDWIRRNAPRLESGFYSITTRLLRRLPISETL